MTRANDNCRIIAGLQEAIAFARGDVSKTKVTVIRPPIRPRPKLVAPPQEPS